MLEKSTYTIHYVDLLDEKKSSIIIENLLDMFKDTEPLEFIMSTKYSVVMRMLAGDFISMYLTSIEEKYKQKKLKVLRKKTIDVDVEGLAEAFAKAFLSGLDSYGGRKS